MHTHLPNGWKMVRLGEVAEVSAGNTAPQKSKYFENGIYPFYRTADVGRVHLSDNLTEVKDCLTDDGIKGLRLFKKRTILFPKSGASTFLNHRVIMGIDGYVSSHLAAIASSEKIISKFLYFYLSIVDAKWLTADQAYPSLKTSDINKIQIPLPPLPTQHKIVEILEEADNLRKLRRQADEKMKDLIPSLFVQMFGDPATNPKKWSMGELGNLINFTQLGLTRSTAEQGFNKPYYYVKMDNIQSGTIDLEQLVKVDASVKEVEEYSLKKYDFLFNTRNTKELVGKTGIFLSDKGEVLFNNNIMRIRFKKAHPIFINYFFQTQYLKQQQNNIIVGTTSVFAIYYKDLAKTKIPLPPLPLQQEFARLVEDVEAEKARQAESGKKIDELFNSLMHRAFIGELAA